jgi:beta-glucosidase
MEGSEIMKFKFPKYFFWGSSNSAYQVEGGNRNNWTEWEKKRTASFLFRSAEGGIANAGRKRGEALKEKLEEVKKNWPNYILNNYPNPLQKENYISSRSCDHYNRYEEDFDIAKSLGHNAHRFSIEWSRIEPEEGRFNKKEIEHYREVIRALRRRKIEPFVTIWHWTIPLWVRDKGGFESKKTSYYFLRYAERITQEFKNDVKFWITINEPEIYAGNSYLKGIWPPQKKKLFSYFKIFKNLIKIHRQAYKIIKNINIDFQVGIAKNNIYFEACQNKIINYFLKNLADWWWNFYFLNKIKKHQDFIGLNYYFHNRIDFGFNRNENKEVSDTGWEIYPEGIYHVLKDLKKYNKPIFITENGLADAGDKKREKFIKEHLRWIHKAIEEGVDVQGYLYWSLLDNFEWDKGFWPRFGLVEIDYKTLERKVRSSAFKYGEICRKNVLIL